VDLAVSEAVTVIWGFPVS